MNDETQELPVSESGDWTDERIAEARTAMAKEMEAEAREARTRQENIRHSYRPKRERN